MPSRHTSEIEKRHLGLLPVIHTTHSQYAVAKPYEKRKTHQIGIPHPHGILHAYLTHQQTVHPPEGKLHEFDALRREVLRERRVDARDEFRHALDAALNARLRADIVVLDSVEETREAPKRVGFYGGKDGRREDRRIDIFGIRIWRMGSHVKDGNHAEAELQPTDVCGQEHFEEGRGEVVDALHVSARGMSYRPDVQYTL